MDEALLRTLVRKDWVVLDSGSDKLRYVPIEIQLAKKVYVVDSSFEVLKPLIDSYGSKIVALLYLLNGPKNITTVDGERVVSISLDELVSNYNLKALGLVRLNSNGREESILSGAQNTLRTLRPHLIVELGSQSIPIAKVRSLLPLDYPLSIIPYHH